MELSKLLDVSLEHGKMKVHVQMRATGLNEQLWLVDLWIEERCEWHLYSSVIVRILVRFQGFPFGRRKHLNQSQTTEGTLDVKELTSIALSLPINV